VNAPIFDTFGKPNGEDTNPARNFTILSNGVYRQSGDVIVNSSDAVTILFYAYNDNGQQMPLKKVFVDWGDGTPYLSGAHGFYKNHKEKCEDPTIVVDGVSVPNPNYNWGDDSRACIDNEGAINGYFAFTHIYTCSETQCTGIKPKIFVEDNWEWCGDGTYKCNTSRTPSTACFNKPPGNTCGWLEYPDEIIINNAAGGGTTVAGPMVVVPSSNVQSCGNVGGPFTPVSQAFTVYNSGTASMSWTASESAAWLNLSSAGGTLAAGQSVVVTASINSTANGYAANTYPATISFNNTTNGDGNTSRNFTLQVLPAGQACSAIINNEN
jgi:hypothetical protein